jgi:hypothetical protein
MSERTFRNSDKSRFQCLKSSCRNYEKLYFHEQPNPNCHAYFITVDSSAVPRARSILLGMWCLRLCLKNGKIESNEGHLMEMPTTPEEPVNTSKINGGKRSTHFSNYLKKCFSQLASDLEKEKEKENISKNVPENVQAGDSIVLERINDEMQEKDRKEKKQYSDIIEVTKAFLDLWDLNTQGPGCALVLVKFLRTKVEEGNWTEGDEAEGGAGGGGGVQKIGMEGKDGVQVEKEVEIAEGWKGDGGGSVSMTEADTGAITTQASGSLPMTIPVSKPVSAPSSVPVTLSGPVDGVSAVIEALLESLSLCPITTHPRLLFVISWLLRPPHADTDTERDGDTENERTIDRTTEGKGGKEERMMTTGKEGNVSEIAPTESVVLDLFAVNPNRANMMNKKSENSAESKRVLLCVLDWLNVRVASLLRVDGSMTYSMLMRKGTVLSLLLVEVCLCSSLYFHFKLSS